MGNASIEIHRTLRRYHSVIAYPTRLQRIDRSLGATDRSSPARKPRKRTTLAYSGPSPQHLTFFCVQVLDSGDLDTADLINERSPC